MCFWFSFFRKIKKKGPTQKLCHPFFLTSQQKKLARYFFVLTSDIVYPQATFFNSQLPPSPQVTGSQEGVFLGVLFWVFLPYFQKLVFLGFGVFLTKSQNWCLSLGVFFDDFQKLVFFVLVYFPVFSNIVVFFLVFFWVFFSFILFKWIFGINFEARFSVLVDERP